MIVAPVNSILINMGVIDTAVDFMNSVQLTGVEHSIS